MSTTYSQGWNWIKYILPNLFLATPTPQTDTEPSPPISTSPDIGRPVEYLSLIELGLFNQTEKTELKLKWGLKATFQL